MKIIRMGNTQNYFWEIQLVQEITKIWPTLWMHSLSEEFPIWNAHINLNSPTRGHSAENDQTVNRKQIQLKFNCLPKLAGKNKATIISDQGDQSIEITTHFHLSDSFSPPHRPPLEQEVNSQLLIVFPRCGRTFRMGM